MTPTASLKGNPRSTGKSEVKSWAAPSAALRCRSTGPGASERWATASPGSSTRWSFPGPSPLSTWPPGAGPPTPGSAGPSSWPSWGFLARHLAGLPVLKPGTSPLLLLGFPALYLYLFAAWRAAAREAGPEVAVEGELAWRFRAWGSWGSIGGGTPLDQALLAMGRFLGPFWLRVAEEKLYLAFPEGGLPTSPFLSPEAALAQ